MCVCMHIERYIHKHIYVTLQILISLCNWEATPVVVRLSHLVLAVCLL